MGMEEHITFRVVNVVYSCKTLGQLNLAYSYYKLAMRQLRGNCDNEDWLAINNLIKSHIHFVYKAIKVRRLKG